MEKQSMTIHRALSELKLIDAKIEKQINELTAVGLRQKGKNINNYIPEEEFTSSAKSKYDSVNDLIARKCNIKSAIVDSNSKTKVTVGGKEMTVADAITFKSIVAFKKKLVAQLKKQHQGCVANLNNNNDQVNQGLQKLLEYTFGKDSSQVSKNDVDNVSKPFLENNQWFLFDPLSVTDKIEKIEKEVADFEVEVDATLSEINAVTLIEV